MNSFLPSLPPRSSRWRAPRPRLSRALFAGMLLSGWFTIEGLGEMPKEDVIDVPAIGEGLCLHNVFQSNMVLQRDQPVAIRGWAAPGEKVTVTFKDQEQEATAAGDRSWKVTFPAMAADREPRSLVVRGSEKTLTLDNILVGDVWVLGGQSNMEFPLEKVENGALEIVSAHFPQIRILTVPAMNGPEAKTSFPRLHEWSGWFGRHFRKGDWDVCSPETVPDLSAIGYVFARRIHLASQIPIGIIDASRGGTTVETWTPDAELRQIATEPVKNLLAEWDQKVAAWNPEKDLASRIESQKQWLERMTKEGKPIPADRKDLPTDLRPGPGMDPNRPGNCFASMIAPLSGLPVKGAIFHQGYNNCFQGTPGTVLYRDVFPIMITAWRAAFGQPDMPFGILSLCTEGSPQTLENFTESMANAGPYLREVQYRTFLDFLNSGDQQIGFTSTYDLRRRWYHPQLKIPAGERIARWALATQYGFDKQIRWKPPLLTEMNVADGRIVLHFDEAVAAVDDGGPIVGFAVAGQDRKFHPADAIPLETGKDDRGQPKKDPKALVLSSPMVPNPVHYRYAWARNPLGNLQAAGNSDIPVATQRSDDWPMENIPLNVFGDTPPAQPDRGQKRQLQEALHQQDLERRLREAEALIRANPPQ